MNNENNNILITILKRKLLFIIIIIFLLGIIPYACYSPISKSYSNYKSQGQLESEIKKKQKELDDIIAENKRKTEAAKKATVKEFFKLQGNDDVQVAYAPMFENVITLIKQNGIRMKSISYINTLASDSLIKNGGGAYNGCQVDFVLVGYYEQFANLLNDLDIYPYFISISKFKINPYQYDKRILIGELSIIFYSKR